MAYSQSQSEEQLSRSKLKENLGSRVYNTLLELLPESERNNQDKIKSISDKLVHDALKYSSNVILYERMEILYKYEKHYLEILKEYKEEIKFAAALQEDLRKERAKFFAETLKEVSATLKTTQVEQSIVSGWIQDLVRTYTQSLDASSQLVTEQTNDILANIQSEESTTIKEATNTKGEESATSNG